MTEQLAGKRWRAMLAMDLDGTLLDAEHALPDDSRAALEWCAAQGVLRVVATGRNLKSAQKVLDAEFPIDRLVSSSGVATYDWPAAALLHGSAFEHEVAEQAVTVLRTSGLDFMLHLAVPDNHGFYYYRTSYENPDFDRRIELYQDHCAPLPPRLSPRRSYSQCVAIGRPDAGAGRRLAELRLALPGAEVIRSTSPLDHASQWFEVYPRGVSKAAGLERLRRACAIADDSAVAVGNDYNDEDMLAWATRSFVVGNGVPELRARYPVVASNADSGVAEVVRRAFGWDGGG